MPNLYIIAGCNGAGKTTTSYVMLPNLLDCKEFINADEIAKGLSPFAPETVSIEAGRIMLMRIKEKMRQGEDFAIETTLSPKSYVKLIHQAHELGYFVTLMFFWLNSPELAIIRVAERIRNGGHFVSEDVIRRRYDAGKENLFNLYIPVSDYWILIDNSTMPFEIVAEGNREKTTCVHNSIKLNQIKYL